MENFERHIRYDAGGVVVDLWEAIYAACGSRKRATQIYDECDVEVEEDGYCWVKDAYNLISEYRGEWKHASAVLNELLEYLDVEEEEEEQEDRCDFDWELQLKILKGLTDAQDANVRDSDVYKRLERLVEHQVRLMEDQFDLLPMQKPSVEHHSLSDRLPYKVDQNTMFQIGKLASRYHCQEYGCRPEQVQREIDGRMVNVNVYSKETVEKTLDRAIREVLNIHS